MEKVVTLNDGRLALASFKNKISARELIQGGMSSDQIRFQTDGQEITGQAAGWKLVGEDSRQLPQGELQLDLKLQHRQVQVTKHFVVYPGHSIIREWLSITNTSAKPITLSDPGFLESGVLTAEVENLDLYYMTGGGAFNGSQLLKREKMNTTYAHTFDSYDPSDSGLAWHAVTALTCRCWCCMTRRQGRNHGGVGLPGPLAFKAGNYDGSPVNLSIQVAGYNRELKPGEIIETPKAFTAVFSGDLDAMGNLLLDWQYQYLWDLTNPSYFAKARWAVDWPSPWAPAGGTPCADNWGRRLALDLRYADLLRETGGDILWDDAGWYDKWGSWNGPDWRLANRIPCQARHEVGALVSHFYRHSGFRNWAAAPGVADSPAGRVGAIHKGHRRLAAADSRPERGGLG